MMRGCGFGDCVPLGDAGLTAALQRHHALDHRPDAKETAALMAPFAPHRSLAAFHLWASLKGVPA
jgi:3-methyladenine DNA glycosylase/8-oxoguanine DNA glycosylase